MVDSPYYRPPDGPDERDRPDLPDAPAPRSVRKTRRTARESIEPEAWVVAFEDTDGQRAERYLDGLARHGIRVRPRIDQDGRVGSWADPRFPAPSVTHQVLVPATEAELAAELIAGPVGEEVAALEETVAFAAQQGDDYFFLRSRMDVEMPRAGRRAKERAARRALAELDGRPVASRPEQEPSDGCRKQMLVALCFVLAALVVLAIILLANGNGLTDPG